MKEETKALYEIANAIDRLTLVIGHLGVLGTVKEGYTEAEFQEAHDHLECGFVYSGMITAMCDAENAIYDREEKGVSGGHIADIVKEC